MHALLVLSLVGALQGRGLAGSRVARPHAPRARVLNEQRTAPTQAIPPVWAGQVADVIPPRAAVLLRSWQKQAEDKWSQGFSPASTMDGMKRMSRQVKQLQRMAALARVMTLQASIATAGAPALPEMASATFAPYVSRMQHIVILAAVAPGNGTAVAFSVMRLPDSAELLHIEASPICSDEHARNAQSGLLDAFLARAADALMLTGTVTAEAQPGSAFEALLLERGFSAQSVGEPWMEEFVRYCRPVALGLEPS
ncbi:hypothetical protein T492DRAFT_1033858 [Pavlovales sp. CCMP2436]|nr:hypothetical protein T492DRAFT_1033858 [Pavlovales sp. CCMP2436]